MKVWWCDALAEAWDMELHDDTPCDKAKGLYGDSPGEHEKCGPMRLIPDRTPMAVDRDQLRGGLDD